MLFWAVLTWQVLEVGESFKIVLLLARMVNVLIESELSRILPAPLREKSGLNVFALTPRED